MKKLTALLLALTCVLALTACSDDREESKSAATEATVSASTDPTVLQTLDLKALEEACADSFLDPSKVTVLGGEWAYTADPDKYVALATVRYTDKNDEYEVAEIVMVGIWAEKRNCFII